MNIVSSTKTASYRFLPQSFVDKSQSQNQGFQFQPFQATPPQVGNVECVEVFQLEYPGIENIRPYVPANPFGNSFGNSGGPFGFSGGAGYNQVSFGAQPNFNFQQDQKDFQD